MTNSLDIQQLWSQLSDKLDRNWKLNLEVIKSTNLGKAKKKMTSLIWILAFTLLFYGAASYLLIKMIVLNWGSTPIVVSGIILAVWTLMICIGTVQELELISRLDYSQPVTVLQKQLGQIRLIIIKYFRLISWILPFSFAFIPPFFMVLFGIDITAEAPINWMVWNVVIVIALFLPITLWINKKLSIKNADKDWMQSVLKGSGSQINEAIVLLQEIEKFEKE